MTIGDQVNEKTVSAVIPTYNDDEYLQRAVSSVLGQNYNNIEILIIDSGDSDIGVELESNYKMVKHHKAPPEGPAAARNVGINEASGEYIAFLDADDEWLPQKLSKQVDKLENNQADFCFSEYIKKNGKPKHVTGIDFPDDVLPHEYYFQKGEGIGSRTVIVSHQCVEDHKFNESLRPREDPHLWVRILRDYDPIKVGEPLAIKHMRSDSLTSDSELVWRNEKKSINLLAKKYSELDKYREMRLRMADYRYAKNLLNAGSNTQAREILRKLYNTPDSRDLRVIALLLVSFLPFGYTETINIMEWAYDNMIDRQSS